MSRPIGLPTFIGTHLIVRTSQAALAFAVSYWVYVTTQSATASALALFARLGPSILTSVFSGWVSDSVSPTRLYAWALTAQCASGGTIGCYLVWTEGAISGLLVLLALASVVDSFTQAGYQRHALNFVDPDHPKKSQLNGRVSIPDSLAPLLGPAAATVGLQLGGLPALFAVDAAICLAAAIFTRLHTHSKENLSTVIGRPRVSPWAGFQAIARTPALRRLQWLFSVQNLCNGVGTGLTAAFLLGAVGASKEQYAAVSMAMAAGAIAGSMLVSSLRVTDAARYVFMMMALGVAALAGRVIPGLWPVLVAVGAGLALRAAMGPVSGAINQSLWLDSIDRTKQGTIFGTRRLLAQITFPLGVGLAALVSASIGNINQHVSELGASTQVGPLTLIFVALGLLELSALLVFRWASEAGPQKQGGA